MSHSSIIEGALQNAFGTSVLVAAAGNDGVPTLDAPMCPSGNMYPACYSYVIGVMAHDSNGNKASFSNWDYENNYGPEYEIIAPGATIYSTLPGNRYASWSGTSMAAPMVSATAALLRSSYPDKSMYSSRYIMGQIASATTKQIVYVDFYGGIHEYAKLDIKDSITKKPKPNMNIAEAYVFDSPDISPNNNGDGIVQPGEVIDLGIGVRNQWGAATDVYLTVNATSIGGVDNPYVEFLNGNEVKIDDVGTFATQNNGFVTDENGTIVAVTNPIRVKIAENAPNDANIQFNLNYRAKNKLDSDDNTVYTQLFDTPYVISVQNGTVIKGKITEDMTFTKDKYYIVENSLLIPRGVTINVEPGTKIQFWSSDQSSVYGSDNIAYIQVEGTMNFIGSQEEPIQLFPGKDFESYRVEISESGSGKVNMDYVTIINPYLNISNANHMSITQDYDCINYRGYDELGKVCNYDGKARIYVDKMSNSTISNLRGRYYWEYAYVNGSFDTVQFDNCQISYNNIKAVNCSFLINQGRVEDPWSGTLQYFTTKLNNVGDIYYTPQLDTVSDIYTIDGEKYVIYQIDRHFYEDMYGDYNKKIENLKIFNNVISKNGGTIPVFDISDSKYDEILENTYDAIMGDNQNGNTVCINLGAYYDSDKKTIVDMDGNEVDSNLIYSGSVSNPFPVLCVYKNPEMNRYWSLHDMSPSYMIAKYPETVSDSKIKNISINLDELGIIKTTAFTNNAILNRLASKNIDDWMKLSSDRGNRATLSVKNNYWGTVDEKLIGKQVIDFDTSISFADYLTSPYLSEPDENIYPCVSDIYITDKNGDKVKTVGNGNYNVHVVFNRDMNTDIQPSVNYGPDDPYTDYTVEGDYINSREWVGSAEIKILINQGQQYFRVKDAVAASDNWLKVGTDWGRFTFEIEATGAEALTLQAEGRENEIYLNWVQDEYDTLAGYNVYRSNTGEEGSYTKINSSIIDEREYTDTKVEAGKKYYYYFTVVDTDMTESRPSNKVLCASIDNVPPVIKHKSSNALVYGINATINATITDNIGVNSAKLYYRMEGEAQYKEVEMNRLSDISYSAQIQAKDMAPGILEYYIMAADGVSVITSGSESEPYKSEVQIISKILNVVADDCEVGKTQTITLNGINFTDDIEVYIDGKKVDSVMESDKVITVSYNPEFMGKKKVELRQNGVVVSSAANSIIVRDPNVRVYNVDSLIIKGEPKWQYIDIFSNFDGKMTSLEYEFKLRGYNSHTYGMDQGYSECNHTYNGDTQIRKYTMNNDYCEGRLFYDGFYPEEDFEFEIVSVSINGVEVEQLDIDMSRVNMISSDNYIKVEDLESETDGYVNIGVGDTYIPEWKVTPSNATDKDYPRYNYDSKYLRFNEDGSFTAIQSGYVHLSVYVGERSIGYDINIAPIPVTAITTSKSEVTGVVGSTVEIEASVEPLESDASLSWGIQSGSDKVSVTSNNKGRKAKLHFNNAGTAVVTVSYGDVSAKIVVESVENNMYTDIEEDIIALNPNQTGAVNATVCNIQDGADTTIRWKSSNTAVVKVSEDGKLTAVAKGYAVVTASLDGVEKKDTVIVLVGSDSQYYISGDVNMDGNVTAADSMLALKLSMLPECPDAVLKMADVNYDGVVTSADAMLILQYVTGKIKSFS